MKNWRFITPSLVTMVLALLLSVKSDVKANRDYTDIRITRHESRPHLVTEKRFDELTKEINKLTIEVRLLRQTIKRNGG